MPDRPPVSVHLLPSLIPPGALRGGVAVVVDVLRATTVMVHALAAGCEAILPCLEVDEARRVAAGLPPGTTLLGGERQGLPIEGFDLGNSPGSYTPDVCRGKTLVMTTTNGTRAILASLEAERIVIGAFVNLEVTARHVQAVASGSIHILCAGTDGQISAEDTLFAGVLTATLVAADTPLGNDQAVIAAGYGRHVLEAVKRGHPLDSFLAHGRGGRRVLQIGLEADLRAAARMNGFALVAELRRDPARIVVA